MAYRKSIVLAIMLAAALASWAQALRFGDDGKFKIVQITDTHYKWEEPDKSKPALDCINSVLQAEHPDLVIFTGDQVYGNGVMQGMTALIGPVKEAGVPFGIIFGNHDHQFDMTLDDIYDYVQPAKGCVMPPRQAPGEYDYAIEIQSAVADRPGYVLYCLDTHSKNSVVPGYDFLFPKQIDWYQATSDAYVDSCGQRIPALMFIHIPLPEMRTAADQGRIAGTKKEKVCCSAMNSGMFLALKEKGDVRAVFCGHDHDNDFVAEYLGVLLGYGRYSGGKTVYNHLKPGARVIELNEMEPNTINTWLRLADGSIVDPVKYTRP